MENSNKVTPVSAVVVHADESDEVTPVVVPVSAVDELEDEVTVSAVVAPADGSEDGENEEEEEEEEVTPVVVPVSTVVAPADESEDEVTPVSAVVAPADGSEDGENEVVAPTDESKHGENEEEEEKDLAREKINEPMIRDGCLAYALAFLGAFGGLYASVCAALNREIDVLWAKFKARDKNVSRDRAGIDNRMWHSACLLAALKNAYGETGFVFRKIVQNCQSFRFEVGKNYVVDGILNRRYFDTIDGVFVDQNESKTFNESDPAWRHSVAVRAHRNSHLVGCRGLPGGSAPISFLHYKDGIVDRKQGYMYAFLKIYEIQICGVAPVMKKADLKPIMNWVIMEEQEPGVQKVKPKKRVRDDDLPSFAEREAARREKLAIQAKAKADRAAKRS